MERGISDKNILNEFCQKFCTILEKHARYIVVSGFLAIASGRARSTEDIDIIVEKLNKQKFTALHDDLVKAGFVCMQSDNPHEVYDEYLTKKASIRYTYNNIPLPEMELKLAKDELDNLQLQNRTKIPFTKLDVWFASINSTIAFKEEYLKSDKDMEDASHLRKMFAEEINEQEIKEIKKLIRKYRL